MNTLNLEAKDENLYIVMNQLVEMLDAVDCPMDVRIQMEVAVEELFVNVAHYAYGEETGMINVEMDTCKLSDHAEISVTFRDSGYPYDPLAKKDPDLTLSAGARPIGGLGIYMVKKSMDSVEYVYKDGMNCLTIRKRIRKG